MLSLFDELLPAFGAGDGDLALSPGNTDRLPASGTIKILMLPIPDPLYKTQVLAVFLIALVGIPGQGTANGPDHQSVRKGSQKQIDGSIVEERADQAGCQTDAQNCHIEPVCSVAPGHKPL